MNPSKKKVKLHGKNNIHSLKESIFQYIRNNISKFKRRKKSPKLKIRSFYYMATNRQGPWTKKKQQNSITNPITLGRKFSKKRIKTRRWFSSKDKDTSFMRHSNQRTNKGQNPRNNLNQQQQQQWVTIEFSFSLFPILRCKFEGKG